MSSNWLKSEYYKLTKMQYKNCLDPEEKCTAKAINAHSMQNAQVLDLLEYDGHVIMCIQRNTNDEPRLTFQSVGRNQAGVFSGLCSAHDQLLFRPIDTNPINLASNEHLFLLAYRSVIRELHAKLQSTIKIGHAIDIAGRSEPHSSAELAQIRSIFENRLSNTRAVYEYKRRLDSGYLLNQFDLVHHEIIHFPGAPPTIAASEFFSVDELRILPYRQLGLVLNIFPSSTGTNVVFSFLAEERRISTQYLAQILGEAGNGQKTLISRVLLQHCENFVVSPAYFNTWSEEKRQIILDFIERTIFQNDCSYESENLRLIL